MRNGGRTANANDNAKIMKYPFLFALVSANESVEFSQYLTQPEILAELNDILSDKKIFGMVRYSNSHPSLNELLLLKKENLLKKLTLVNSLDHVSRVLMTKPMSHEEYMSLMRTDIDQLEFYDGLLSQQGVEHLYNEGHLTLNRLQNLTKLQIANLIHPRMQELYATDVMILNLDAKPVLSVDELLRLTEAESKILVQNIYRAVLTEGLISPAELLRNHSSLNTELKLAGYLAKKAIQVKMAKELLVGIDPSSHEKLFSFAPDLIAKYFGKNNINRKRNIEAVANYSKSDVDKLARQPEELLDLFFIHDALTLEKILNLTKDELQFFQRSQRNAAMAEELTVKGRFNELYELSRGSTQPSKVVDDSEVFIKLDEDPRISQIKAVCEQYILYLTPKIESGKCNFKNKAIAKRTIVQDALDILNSEKSNDQKFRAVAAHLNANAVTLGERRDSGAITFLKGLAVAGITLCTIGIGTYFAYRAFFVARGEKLIEDVTKKSQSISPRGR